MLKINNYEIDNTQLTAIGNGACLYNSLVCHLQYILQHRPEGIDANYELIEKFLTFIAITHAEEHPGLNLVSRSLEDRAQVRGGQLIRELLYKYILGGVEDENHQWYYLNNFIKENIHLIPKDISSTILDDHLLDKILITSEFGDLGLVGHPLITLFEQLFNLKINFACLNITKVEGINPSQTNQLQFYPFDSISSNGESFCLIDGVESPHDIALIQQLEQSKVNNVITLFLELKNTIRENMYHDPYAHFNPLVNVKINEKTIFEPLIISPSVPSELYSKTDLVIITVNITILLFAFSILSKKIYNIVKKKR